MPLTFHIHNLCKKEVGWVGVTFATKAKTNLTDLNRGRFCFFVFSFAMDESKCKNCISSVAVII